MKDIFLYGMALFYIIAGSYHFIQPKSYRRIVPRWLPWQMQIVYISGACEIILALLLFPQSSRNFAAWGIIILLIIIFPANIQMMLNFRRKKNRYLWITILRLPVQLLLIWWAWQFSG